MSGGVGRKVASIVVPGFQKWDEVKQEQYVTGIDFFVCKTAHFTEYMILGGLWLLCIYNNPKGSSPFSFWKKMGLSVCASAIYAMSDEFHQLFVEGRAGKWMDVGIDTMGAIVGTGLVTIGIKLFILIRAIWRKEINNYEKHDSRVSQVIAASTLRSGRCFTQIKKNPFTERVLF